LKSKMSFISFTKFHRNEEHYEKIKIIETR